MLNVKGPSFKKGSGVAKTAAPTTPTVDPPQNPLVGKYYGPKTKPATSIFRPAIRSKKSRVFEFESVTAGSTATEVIRKRSLMKVESGRIYSQLGTSLKAYEMARMSLIWLNQLRDATKEDEDSRDRIEKLVKLMAGAVEELFQMQSEKRQLTADMEVALTKASRDISRSRKRALDIESEVRRKGLKSLTPEEDHPETAAPEVAIDPNLILQNAREEILAKERFDKEVRASEKGEVPDFERDEE
jgi:hypothetical protein